MSETNGPRNRRATITMIAMRASSRPYSTSVCPSSSSLWKRARRVLMKCLTMEVRYLLSEEICSGSVGSPCEPANGRMVLSCPSAARTLLHNVDHCQDVRPAGEQSVAAWQRGSRPLRGGFPGTGGGDQG